MTSHYRPLSLAVEDVTKDSDEMVRFALRLLDHVKTCRISREVGWALGWVVSGVWESWWECMAWRLAVFTAVCLCPAGQRQGSEEQEQGGPGSREAPACSEAGGEQGPSQCGR